MYVGHILHKKLHIPNILKIQKVGINRVKVQLRDIKDANNLVQNDLLQQESLKAFIPNNLLIRKGVVRHVDTIFDDKYLLENFTSPVTIIEVQRIKRKILIDNEPALIPRQTVLVTFEGNYLPKYIYVNSVACAVEPYVQKVIQCYKCLKYAHVANQCRSTKTLCINCGKIKEEGHLCVDPSDSYCIYCKTNGHKSISKTCPEYLNQQKIKEHMANSNTTYSEAKNDIDNSYANAVQTSNRFQILDEVNETNFPPLPPPSRRKDPPVRNSTLSQPLPSTSISTESPYNNNPTNTIISQHNRKRKATSPLPAKQNPPMFPFNFGPKTPISITSNDRTYIEDVENSNKFSDFFFNFFRSVLADIESFEDLKNIDGGYLKNKIGEFYNNPNND